MYVSANGKRTWVEITEPMLRAYVTWKTGPLFHGGGVQEPNRAPLGCGNEVLQHPTTSLCRKRAASPEHVSGDNAESMMAQTYGFNSFMKTKSMANVQKSSQSHDTNGGESPRTGLKGAFKKKKGMAYFYNPYS